MQTFTRRSFLKYAGAGITGLSFSGCSLSASGINAKKPNILFIMVDDLGPEWISCYGAQDIETPNVDALARSGMRFENAYSMPKCTPTRVSLLTGQYPWRSGWINHWDVPRWGCGCHFDPDCYTTFARVLKGAGYKTAAAGKWQINDFRVEADAMARHGFDDWCMWTGFESGNKPSAERYWDPYINTPSGSRTYQGKFGTDVFVDFLLEFMKKHRDRPMMIYFPMALTHTPFVTTPSEKNAQTNIDKHKAMVRYMDLAVGRLIKGLEELGIRDDTVVFFTTDNGTARGINGRMNGRLVKGGKGTLGENGCREPFIVSCPGKVPSGVVTDALTDFTDMMPTFAEIAGAALNGDVPVDGVSIAPVLFGKAKETERKWILAMGGGTAKLVDGRVVPEKDYADRVIRDKRYKLWIENGRPTRLYDLRADPGEKNNIIGSLDKSVIKAENKLNGAYISMPSKDAVPRYSKLPAQVWDKKGG